MTTTTTETTTIPHVRLLQLTEEIQAFLDWLRPYAPRHICEIGSADGGTAILFCHLARGLVISVDLPDGYGGGVSREACDQRTAMLAAMNPQYRAVLGDSHDPETRERVAALLQGEPLDLLFIDGDHTYAGVTQDLAMYGPLVKPGGFIAFHDINDTDVHRQFGCEVHRLWQELPGGKKEFNVHGKWGGIGVVQVSRPTETGAAWQRQVSA